MQKSPVLRKLFLGAGILVGLLVAVFLLLLLRTRLQQQSGVSKTPVPASIGSVTPTPKASATPGGSAVATPTPVPTPFVDPQSIQGGDRGLLVATVQNRLYTLGYYPYKPTGYFAGMTQTAVRNFQAANNLLVDGIVSEDTLAVLFSNDVKYAAATPVPLPAATPPSVRPRDYGEALIFSKVNTLIPNGSPFLVVDLFSQYYFYAVRTGGLKHMEISPATAEDMDRYLAIFAGRSSMEKRPCVVEFNGKIIASSLCGWLHGSDNAQTLCLYFFGSTAEDSSMEDQEHNANLLLSSNGIKPQ